MQTENSAIFFESIKKLFENEHENNGICAQYIYSGKENFIYSNSLEICKIIKKIINTITCHSGTDEVRVFIRINQWDFSIEIDDNGAGFNKQTTFQKKNLKDLKKIAEKVENLKGLLTFFSNLDRTVVYIEIPLEEQCD